MKTQISFNTAFGLEFGASSTSTENNFNMARFGLEGHGLKATISQLPYGRALIAEGSLGYNGFQFATIGEFIDLANKAFPNPAGAQQNILNRLDKIQDRTGPEAWFPFFSFGTLSQQKAYPKAGRQLIAGELFYMTFEDNDGNQVCVEAAFAQPEDGCGIYRKQSNPEVFYQTR